MKSVLLFCLAALFEIAGCFCLWRYFRDQRSAWLLLPGTISLFAFAYLLTRVESAFAGRAYAAYGGIYVAASLLWLWAVERTAPDRFDLIGSLFCLAGTGIILFGRHS